MKIAVIGCGLRTPLLMHGLAKAGMGISKLALYDLEASRAELMAAMGNTIAEGSGIQVSAEREVENAVRESAFVISSIRVGGMEGRARDERLALQCGFAGQETTGPAGFAMALRTVPVAVEYARVVERVAPEAWIVNFTNPAGLITQAIATHTAARVAGICDTPAELFFRIALALREPPEDVECDYLGLNHLGWVRAVRVRGEDVTEKLLRDDGALSSLYPSKLFSVDLIRGIRLIPSEYLFFYYNGRSAKKNQTSAGATRGEELLNLNGRLMLELERNVQKGDMQGALRVYRAYLNRRNASYLHLEGAGTSAFEEPEVDWDPFEGATGYHRIAVETISALSSPAPKRIVLNVENHGAIGDFGEFDVVEAPCMVDQFGPRAMPAGRLPESVRGLAVAVKAYERMTIDAAMRGDKSKAVVALFTNPIVGDWEAAREFVERL